jgi:hypothetical protein
MCQYFLLLATQTSVGKMGVAYQSMQALVWRGQYILLEHQSLLMYLRLWRSHLRWRSTLRKTQPQGLAAVTMSHLMSRDHEL